MKNPCAGCPNVKAGCKARSQCADFQAYENHMLNTEYPRRAERGSASGHIWTGDNFIYTDKLRRSAMSRPWKPALVR